MPDIIIVRPDPPIFTHPDLHRGTDGPDILGRDLSGFEQQVVSEFTKKGFARDKVLDVQFLSFGTSNPGFLGDDRLLGEGGNNYVGDLIGSNFVMTEEDDDRILTGFQDDRIFDQGGNNRIRDLGGNNSFFVGEGDDQYDLGSGNDRIIDRGGDNFIIDAGGDNLITTDDGDDTVTTGAGDDLINVFDGLNFVDAGNGDNSVRGGRGFDEVRVGLGDDFVELRGGTAGETDVINIQALGLTFEANNFVLDRGGDDNFRSTETSGTINASEGQRFDDLVVSDLDATQQTVGNDQFTLGGGDNLVVDFGGNDRVRTFSGDDIVLTSLAFSGADDIDTGGGDDFINPGSGADIVRGGAGKDIIELEFDGSRDSVAYGTLDFTFDVALSDIVSGFEPGRDVFDLRLVATDEAVPLDIDFDDVVQIHADLLDSPANEDELVVALDADGNSTIDFFVAVLEDFGDAANLTPNNFFFATMAIA
jgi:hypothetical protein